MHKCKWSQCFYSTRPQKEVPRWQLIVLLLNQRQAEYRDEVRRPRAYRVLISSQWSSALTRCGEKTTVPTCVILFTRSPKCPALPRSPAELPTVSVFALAGGQNRERQSRWLHGEQLWHIHKSMLKHPGCSFNRHLLMHSSRRSRLFWLDLKLFFWMPEKTWVSRGDGPQRQWSHYEMTLIWEIREIDIRGHK